MDFGTIMKSGKNRIKGMIVAGAFLAAVAGTAFAEAPAVTVQAAVGTGTEIAPCADNIKWIYRNNNGVREKRRWNYTKNRWEDPAWIPVP